MVFQISINSSYRERGGFFALYNLFFVHLGYCSCPKKDKQEKKFN